MLYTVALFFSKSEKMISYNVQCITVALAVNTVLGFFNQNDKLFLGKEKLSALGAGASSRF